MRLIFGTIKGFERPAGFDLVESPNDFLKLRERATGSLFFAYVDTAKNRIAAIAPAKIATQADATRTLGLLRPGQEFVQDSQIRAV